MKIDAIHRVIVLDHIKAGRAMDIYRYLHLTSCNARSLSSKMPAAKPWG